MIDRIVKSRGIKAKVGKLKEQIHLGPESFIAAPSMTEVEAQVAYEYFRECREYGMVDYDSVLHWGMALMEKVPLTCEHLLVDEFQDASDRHDAIYQAIQAKTKTFVADPFQAIFSFMGGDVQNVLGMSEDPGVKVFCLHQSYRLPVSVADRAKTLIGNLITPTKEQGLVTFQQFGNEIEEAAFVAGAAIGNCAVLCRTNQLADFYASEMERLGTEVVRESAATLPPIWSSAILCLELMANPDNDLLAFQWVQTVSGTEAANKAKQTALAAATSINRALFHLDRITVAEDAVRQLGDSDTFRGSEAPAAMREILAEMPAGCSIQSFLVELNGARFRVPRTENRGVVVTTYHRAKGREFDTVILPALEEGILPSRQAIGAERNGSDKGIQEDRRTLYVGMTRARKALVLTASETRSVRGQPEAATVSRFVKECGL